jgi:hypothetical protein
MQNLPGSNPFVHLISCENAGIQQEMKSMYFIGTLAQGVKQMRLPRLNLSSARQPIVLLT